MASSGTTTALGRVPVARLASMNIPGLSNPLGLGARAFIRIVRFSFSTTGSMNST